MPEEDRIIDILETIKKIRNYSALQIKAIDNESTFDSFL
jgi:hypothetical protein